LVLDKAFKISVSEHATHALGAMTDRHIAQGARGDMAIEGFGRAPQPGRGFATGAQFVHRSRASSLF
jgi:hypothetical protein